MAYPDPPQHHFTTLIVLVVLFLTALYVWAAPAQLYDVEVLDVDVRTIGALDRQGLAYGSALFGGSQHAAKAAPGQTIDLGLLSYFSASRAAGAAGRHVVGDTWRTGTAKIRAWVYQQGDASVYVLDPGGDPDKTSAASDTNQHWSVGYAVDHNGRQRPTYWDNRTRKAYFQPTLADQAGVPVGDGWVDAVNMFGFGVGQSQNADGDPLATLWFNGHAVDLDTTPGKVFSAATDINDWLGIVGQALWPEGARGFLTLPRRFAGGVPVMTELVPLPPLPGDAYTGATVINNAWDICGFSAFVPPATIINPNPNSTLKAACWSTTRASILDDQGAIDLNTRINAPGWVLQAVHALNDQGVMIVSGRLNGQPRFARLTPHRPGFARR